MKKRIHRCNHYPDSLNSLGWKSKYMNTLSALVYFLSYNKHHLLEHFLGSALNLISLLEFLKFDGKFENNMPKNIWRWKFSNQIIEQFCQDRPWILYSYIPWVILYKIPLQMPCVAIKRHTSHIQVKT